VTDSVVRPEIPALLDWGVAVARRAGEERCGDQSVVRAFAGGMLAGVIDGLGHGDAASDAATQAVDIVGSYSGSSLLAMVRQCHEGLIGTRGVVMSLAWFNPANDSMTWLGVGNVEGVLRRAGAGAATERLMPAGGVVGFQLPPLRPVVATLARGDTLALATDGLRGEFAERVDARERPAGLAELLLRQFARPTDDALILVARYLGAKTA
jgi:hypothetical protein